MRLGCKVVDLVRLAFLHHTDEVGRIRQIAVVEFEALILFMRILVDVLDSPRVERGRSALDPMDNIALCKQKFGQIGPILPRYAGYQSYLRHLFPFLQLFQCDSVYM
ncbi:hypothetical protein D3C72_1611590 [compost metagenome]